MGCPAAQAFIYAASNGRGALNGEHERCRPQSRRYLGKFHLITLHQYAVVMLPGVEVAAVEIQVVAYQRAKNATAAPQPTQAVAPDPPVPQQAIALEHVAHPFEGVPGEEEGALHHGP